MRQPCASKGILNPCPADRPRIEAIVSVVFSKEKWNLLPQAPFEIFFQSIEFI
jgi:hypothetical protein